MAIKPGGKGRADGSNLQAGTALPETTLHVAHARGRERRIEYGSIRRRLDPRAHFGMQRVLWKIENCTDPSIARWAAAVFWRAKSFAVDADWVLLSWPSFFNSVNFNVVEPGWSPKS